MFDQKSVMPHRRVYLAIHCIGYIGCETLHVLRRENDIGCDADNYRWSGYTLQSGLDSAAPTPDIVRIKGIEYRDIRIGIEALYKFLALVPLVGTCAMRCRDAIRTFNIALRGVIPASTTIRQHPNGTRRGQSRCSRVRCMCPEGGVRTYCHTLSLVYGQGPGRSACVGSYERKCANAQRFLNGPFDSLKPTDTTAHKCVYAANAQIIGQ